MPRPESLEQMMATWQVRSEVQKADPLVDEAIEL